MLFYRDACLRSGLARFADQNFVHISHVYRSFRISHRLYKCIPIHQFRSKFCDEIRRGCGRQAMCSSIYCLECRRHNHAAVKQEETLEAWRFLCVFFLDSCTVCVCVCARDFFHFAERETWNLTYLLGVSCVDVTPRYVWRYRHHRIGIMKLCMIIGLRKCYVFYCESFLLECKTLI
jgi:hypothetical protein